MSTGVNNFGRRNVVPNFQEARAPLATDDTTANAALGSIWFNTANGSAWICTSNTAGAADWQPLLPTGGMAPLAYLTAANMNATTDQAFTWNIGSGTKCKITDIVCVNPSISLTTAAGGIYPTTAKGGNALVASSQVYTNATGSGTIETLTLSAYPPKVVYAAGTTTLYLSLTTAQGAAATADLYVFGELLPTG